MFDVLPENHLHEGDHVNAWSCHHGGSTHTSSFQVEQVTQWPLLDEHEIISWIAASRMRQNQHTSFVFVDSNGDTEVAAPEIPPPPHKWPKPQRPKPIKPKPAPPWPTLPVILTPRPIPAKYVD
eukprot:gnl/MRDRNA2_/MRDRNA2_156158_c0_seq1.p1 gnl/MRDRNA2_/MRDRNA2_156158_c0~~gnl/MRDRNA2_/MRDRNA2_156158_c0_seq1.p1  ORF type:complete len:124 (+),score=17.21 gnl/MRDRNA2_/MRDRNA2_156158_c0_seq1:81-452(+)